MLNIRKIGVFSRTYRHLNRYRQILGVLFKYGFGDIVDLLRIEQYIEIGLQLISRKKRERLDRLSRAERIRMAIEELGPTYIKLGQILSTRPDLVPVDFVKEFAKLQDKVSPAPFEQIRDIIEYELEKPLDGIFDSFDQTPLASASIGQVYRAKLKNGETVAVKVQRPGIKGIIQVDLEIMLHLATLMERHVKDMDLHRPVTIVKEFAKTLEKEIDYTIEANNMQRMAGNFLGDETVYVPMIYRETSTTRVLTTEYVDGIKISKIERLEHAGLDRHIITDRGADLVLRQVFQFGFFHADPHPGNIFALPGNVICLLDFGMVGSVDRQTREEFVDLIDSVVHKNEVRTTQALLELTQWDEEPDRRVLEKDVADFLGQHLYKPIKEIQFARLIHDMMELTTRHRLLLPPDIFLMMKAISCLENVARVLDPEFDMITKAAPFVERVKIERYLPHRIAGDLFATSSGLFRFARQFPKDLLEITRLLRQHKFGLKIELPNLDDMLATHDQISNRISFSIIIAALIIGSALIVISKSPPYVFGISLIGMIGFLAAAVMGIWLLIAILKKGRL